MRPDYRPDIDGLRAIAVLSVLAHHLSPNLLPGGFVGVDIFFVISGYLITSHIYKEVGEGSFTLKRFYQRRINRIVPALLTVLTATLLAGSFLLSPVDLVRLSKCAIFALLGFSNIFLWREYGNYFAANAGEAPLLHTWSLGVEEQFYVVWPFMVMLLLKVPSQWRISVLALLTVCAVAVSQTGANNFTSASYYLLPTRFFELMIGGLLALWLATHPKVVGRFAKTAYLAGFALIGGSLFLLGKDSLFPGLNALWPCLGAALLICAGGGGNLCGQTSSAINRSLSSA